MNRRKFMKNSVLGALGLSLPIGIYAWQIEPFEVEFVKMEMPIENLPTELEGKLLVQLSDLHIGDRFDYRHLIHYFELTQKLNPDFVVYTGDFVNYQSPKQLGQLEEVKPHFTKGKLGTFGVLGNHDYGKNWAKINVANEIVLKLEQAGIKILRNETYETDNFQIIGIDDFWSPNFDGKKALKTYDPQKANLVLCHNPDVCDLPIWNNYKGWILAGHTHGGQVKAPFLPPFILPVKNKK